MRETAPAKVNLGLHVLRRREDGYHDIETVMLRLDWFDTIEVESAQGLSMSCSDPSLSAGPDNLCIKAARALAERLGMHKGAAIHLEKRVPAGAGLGGGSSDAAATLRVLQRLWDVELPDRELKEIAASLGADVPFFLGASPAIARGIGDRLNAIAQNNGEPIHIPFHFVVVKPSASVSTRDAYGWVTPSDDRRANLEGIIRSCDLDRWREELVNDFERPVMERIPEVGYARDLLVQTGAGFAAMSGSGSAVYGVFETQRDAETARAAAAAEGFACWAGTAE